MRAMHPHARDVDLEVELELIYELDPDPLPAEPVLFRPHDPDLLVELELIDDELADPWFLRDGAVPVPEADVYAIDPIHPLRRLGAWLRNAPRARA